MIGDDIVVEIVEITSDKLRLGIMCPKEVPVHRREIWDAIQQGNKRLRCQAPDELD